MRLSTKGQYAVRAMVSLVCHANGRPTTLKEISDSEDISLPYLEQLFVKLRKGGIVKSVRGPGGGYVLARPASEIKVGDVITVVEESLNPVACLDGNPSICTRTNKCVTQRVWKGLADKMQEFLNSITIEDLSREANQLKVVERADPVGVKTATRLS